MPLFCGDTWSDNQIIVEVPEDIDFVTTSDFVKDFITVKNITTNLYSSGENNFEVYDDSSLPSICSITPDAGPAPRDNVTLKGINFSNDPAVDPTVYFYTENSQMQNRESVTGWLFTPFSDVFLINLYNDGEGQGIDTPIPYDVGFGYSMMTGMSPIKIKDNLNRFSNSVYYNVQDCRVTGSTAPNFQCCTEGSAAGQIQPIAYGCQVQIKSWLYLEIYN
jgi:hypothetical protein